MDQDSQPTVPFTAFRKSVLSFLFISFVTFIQKKLQKVPDSFDQGKNMAIRSFDFIKVSIISTLLVKLVTITSYSQPNASSKPETITCIATNTQTPIDPMGATFKIRILIQGYSAPEDRKALLAAFNQAGHKALYDAVSKMHSKGRVYMPGKLGFDISYVSENISASGRTFRMVTNRPVSIGAIWTSDRPMKYDLSYFEISIPNSKAASGWGTFLPAGQIKVNKKNGEIEPDTYKFLWRLENVISWGTKQQP